MARWRRWKAPIICVYHQRTTAMTCTQPPTQNSNQQMSITHKHTTTYLLQSVFDVLGTRVVCQCGHYPTFRRFSSFLFLLSSKPNHLCVFCLVISTCPSLGSQNCKRGSNPQHNHSCNKPAQKHSCGWSCPHRKPKSDGNLSVWRCVRVPFGIVWQTIRYSALPVIGPCKTINNYTNKHTTTTFGLLFSFPPILLPNYRHYNTRRDFNFQWNWRKTQK